MTRITIKDLRRAIGDLNESLGMPRDGWKDGKAYPGAYVLDAAYGGYRLAQYANDCGGERDITGRDTARVTYDAIRVYRAGIEAGRNKSEG